MAIPVAVRSWHGLFGADFFEGDAKTVTGIGLSTSHCCFRQSARFCTIYLIVIWPMNRRGADKEVTKTITLQAKTMNLETALRGNIER